jgi:hypothetical protein
MIAPEGRNRRNGRLHLCGLLLALLCASAANASELRLAHTLSPPKDSIQTSKAAWS